MSDRLIERLNELQGLQDGWLNGRGLAPTEDAIEVAFPLAVALKDDGPSLFPTELGGLKFEGAGFEIDISSCGLSRISLDEEEASE